MGSPDVSPNHLEPEKASESRQTCLCSVIQIYHDLQGSESVGENIFLVKACHI